METYKVHTWQRDGDNTGAKGLREADDQGKQKDGQGEGEGGWSLPAIIVASTSNVRPQGGVSDAVKY